jgi:hypothetical protein
LITITPGGTKPKLEEKWRVFLHPERHQFPAVGREGICLDAPPRRHLPDEFTY